MFFKRFASLVAAVSLITVASSCSLYEGPPPQRDDAFQKANLGCMKDFREILLSYVDGKATPESVTRIAACSIEGLRTFSKYTRGETRDRFTAQEIRNFLQRYFLEDVTISDGLLKEFMRVKQAFIGGKTSDFSREDLKMAEGLIEALRDILLRLQPSMPLSVARMERESPAYVEEAGKALVDAAEILGNKITENKSTYSIEDMGRFCDEMMLTFNGSKRILSSIRSNLKLAGIVKEIAIAPNRPREVVTAGDWRILFQEGSRWAATYLRFMNMNAQYPNWTRGEGRTHFGSIVYEAMGHIDRMVARHCPEESITRKGCRAIPGIPIKSLQSLIETLEWDGELAGIKLRKSTLQGLLEPVIQRVLGGEDITETGRNSVRLTSVHVDRLRSLIRDWLDGSRYVEGAFATVLHNENFADAVSIPTQDLVVLDPASVLRDHGGVTPSALGVAEALRATYRKTMAIADHESPGALFDGKNASRPRVYREMDQYAWLRPIFKQVVRGYIEGPNRKARAENSDNDGLTTEEFTAFIRDYWQVLADLKLVGPKNTPEEDGKRRVREASLFTQVSDGNKVISADEGLQLVLYMFSADPLSRRVHDRAEKFCRKGPLDPYGEPVIEPLCYREKMYNFSKKNTLTSDLWKPFPALIQYYDGLGKAEQAEFQEYVEAASRAGNSPVTAWFGSSETQAVVMMFHYIEALFLRYDTNRDGAIDRAEAELAFPVFENTLSEISGMQTSDAKLKSVFFYLLSHGAPPVDDGMGRWRKFWHGMDFMLFHWRAHDITADRLSVLKVFATLAQPVASTDHGDKAK